MIARIHPVQSRPGGFSLVEVVIALAVISAIAALAAATLGPWLAFRQSMETERRLKETVQALEAGYRENAMAIDNNPGAVLAFPGSPIANNTTATATTFSAVERYSSLSAAQMASDGFNMPVLVFVSNRLSQQVEGVTLYYHIAAVVSGGRNGVIQPGTSFDAATGRLVLAGDDKGMIVDGYRVQRANYDLTLAKIRRLALAWQDYFQSRYLAVGTRDVSIDYFGSPGTPANRWDSGNSVPNTNGAYVSAVSAGIHSVLGLSVSEVTDAYGQALRIDNSSAMTRNPGNPNPSMTTPPYTARVSTVLPGGVVLEMSVSGLY